MRSIANHVASALAAANRAVIVDVREPAEFREGHLPDAVNLPSTQFSVGAYRKFNDRAICLICQSGSRAGKIAAELREHGMQNVYLLEQQMGTLTSAQTAGAPPNGWSIDRQFRLTLGLLLLIFLLGYFVWSTLFIVIPAILCAGLLITSIIDRCYLRMGIAMLPWNQGQPERSAEVEPTLLSGRSGFVVPVEMKKSAS